MPTDVTMTDGATDTSAQGDSSLGSDSAADAPRDTSTGMDVQVDTPVAMDVQPDLPIDAPPPSLAGIWRLTALDTTTDAGMFHVNDTDTTVMVNGLSVHARVNGIMELTSGSYSFSSALATSLSPPPDHVGQDDGAVAMGMPRLSANGFGVAGTLDDTMNRFISVSIGGMAYTVNFTRNADGTITSDASSTGGLRLTWQRLDRAAIAQSMLTSHGRATSIQVNTGAYLPFVHPRVVILWDRPNRGTGYTPTNDVAITIPPSIGQPPISAEYPQTFTATPPANAIFTTGGVQIGLGYTVVYDDVNNNMQFDVSTDTIRGISTIGMGWRGTGTPDSTFATSVGADLVATGYQLSTVYGYLTGAATAAGRATPLDPTHPLNLDAPILNQQIPATSIPDLL